jgi:transcriptional regulator with XRE-family HTH domain
MNDNMKEENDKKENLEPKKFSARIAQYREKLGLSQTELAEKANLSPAALSRILSGERTLKPEHARDLASVLNITTLELLQDTEFMEVWHGWVEISDLFALQKRLERTENDYRSLQVQHEGMRAENAALKDQLIQLIGKLDSKEQENSLLKGQLQNESNAQEEMGRLRNLVANLQAERNNLVSQIQTMDNQNQTLRNRYQILESVAQKLNLRMTQLSRELEESKSSKTTSAIISAMAGYGLAKVLEDN